MLRRRCRGCGALTRNRRPWCSACRPSSAQLGYDAEHRRQRRAQLDRQPYCELAYPDICTGAATVLEHKRSMRNGGAKADPANHQSACGPCNSRKAATIDRKRRPPS